MRIALALAALAATSLYVALKVNEDVINEAIRDALDSAEVEGGVPPEAYEWAPRMAFVVPPVAVFSFVFIVTSLVACLCSCGDKPPRAVAVGRPLGPGQTIALNIWSDGLCSCCNDVGLCCSAICLPCVPLAQLYERVYGARHSCTMIAGAFALASLLVTSTSSVCKTSVECTTHVDAYGHSVPSCVASSPLDAPAICDYVEGLSTFTTFLLIVVLMLVRARVRAHYGIAPSCCGPLDDCCCAFCCLPFATCQLVRHLNVAQGARYKLFSRTGKPEEITGAPLV